MSCKTCNDTGEKYRQCTDADCRTLHPIKETYENQDCTAARSITKEACNGKLRTIVWCTDCGKGTKPMSREVGK